MVILVIFFTYLFIADFFKELKKISILETETIVHGRPLSKNIALRKMYLKFSILFGIICTYYLSVYLVFPSVINVIVFTRTFILDFTWYIQLVILFIISALLWFVYFLILYYIKNMVAYEKHVLYLDINHDATLPAEETFED